MTHGEARCWEARMEASGCWPKDSPWIRPAMVDKAPRHQYAPDLLWVWDGSSWASVERTTDPERWTSAVYGGPYESTVTQITDGLPTSSLSCGSVVADMLDSLELSPGDRVLELGTGPGWNAALLAERAGPGRVVSVEVDAQLAAAARTRLRTAGFSVEVHTGDGAAGLPAGAPYDRLIATYAVESVPWAWVEQTRPGGRIVTPWGRLGHVALTVADDGRSASGWVQGLATFMPARGTDQGLELSQIPRDGQDESRGRFPRPVRELADGGLLFALRVLSPDIRITVSPNDDATAWLHDGRASWAVITADHGDGPGAAVQGGPRLLADEIAQGRERWTSAGRPSLYDFGMTRTSEEQYIWYEDAEGVRHRWEPSVPMRRPRAVTSKAPAVSGVDLIPDGPGVPSGG
ncbi:methyltransferase domain-containing protein [Streptomyces sp. WP-1]|uniref:methyltransferase domain-containing protein n=1 Tax=Streptomyces sp. WP-1 TaxID=3041497 RepID=UPI0026488D8B|nr:methyltransferase domain-containing protein [Streptomyces sp. WP-1]WKE73545.1 methyltransferase domain-containing protein [Streptomyces sp. WP-1]